MLDNFFYFLVGLLALAGLVTLGFVIPPRPFRMHPAPSQPGEPAPLPPDLPAPVHRHFEETIGLVPPQVHSAVIWGRGRAHIRGVWLPLRFRGWYRPGEAFTRRIEVTWFQRPILRGRESLIAGKGAFQMGDRDERGAHADQNETLALWTAAFWTPGALVHLPAGRWEPVDEHTSRLVYPGPGGQETLLAHFDPETGRMTHVEAERFIDDEPARVPWRMDMLEWKTFRGQLIPYHVAIAWGESGAPRSYWTIDGLAENVNVSDQLG